MVEAVGVYIVFQSYLKKYDVFEYVKFGAISSI